MVIQHGTLCVGDVLVAGEAWCRVRTMLDDGGGRITQAPPSTPVLTTGWRNMPLAGDICLQVCVNTCMYSPCVSVSMGKADTTHAESTASVQCEHSHHNHQWILRMQHSRCWGGWSHPCKLLGWMVTPLQVADATPFLAFQCSAFSAFTCLCVGLAVPGIWG